ncbi:uncharacterized protein LOC122071069 isoform X2 [Macadamia integrifolia]|uniref:uncharacterized protein LOC122071069 isoform X2 n=1 Tax=Macadamia integrifolia TaxID=60698 RepID=UPI001C4E7A65|nr:uncharacterized protein LOC122071069 isoform X2 [Macadamia integrifolia]
MGFNEIRGRVILSIRCFCRWVGTCSLILGLVVFFFLLYRYIPSVFSFLLSFLLSSSPIVVCTAVLLRALFSFGHPNVHKDKKKEKEEDDNSAETPPSLGVRRRHITDKTKSSGFRSHHAETSVDGIPQDWESGPSQPSHASLDGSYAVSECSMASNDGSFEMEDETERLEDGIQPLEWTEDDEKNLMDLGTSELERNRRLENLIARRRATKLLRLAAEKDLIDFDNNEFFQIPAITTKRNDPPLDISYNPIDASELPPIPCSAPPVLSSTRNPFDIPYDPHEEKPNLMEDSFQEEFMLVSQKDVQFCRHESFSLGPSSIGEPKKDIRDSKLTPFVVTEQITSESVLGGGYPSFTEGMNHERSDSVVSSAPEAKPLSFSVADLGDQEKFIEQDLSEGGKMISHTCFVPESVEQESQASNEVVNSNFESIEQEENREVRIIEIPRVEKEITHEMDSESTTSDSGEVYMKPEVPRKYEGLSSSPLKEEDDGAGSEKTFDNNKDAGLENPSCHVPEGTDYNQTEEPYYDSSPSAIDKKTSKENLFYVDKGVILTTACSIASDLQVEVSQAGSPPAPLDRTFSQTDEYFLVHSEGSIKEELSSGSELPYDASSYPSDEGNESRSNQITRCSELETRRSGQSGDIDNEAALHVMLETAVVEQVSSNSSWDSVAVEHVSINTSSSSSPPPMDQIPSATPDPNVLLNKKEEVDYVACNDSDALSHEASNHPFKAEVSSSNEGPYGASSHPGGDENESRANIIIQISEVETTKAGLSGGSEDPAALNLVSEPMVVEQVSSHSLPELEGGDSVACNDSDALSHEALTYPFEGEVSSGNEGPYGASSHPGGDENELRASRIIQTSEVETTKVGLSGSSEDSAALNLVLEPIIAEQVSSHSLPELDRGDSVACNDSDALSLEALTYPFKEEVSSGNEGPHGASSHPDGDENDSRASRIIQSSEVETTKAGLSGGIEDPAALNLVSKPMVVEQVSSHSLAELEGSDSVASNNSDALSHEALTYPFQGEVSSSNEGPYGASSHPGGDENESRANRFIQSSEVETTEAGFSGGSEDPAALNLVPEPMVVEQASSHLLPELEGEYSVARNDSDALSHEALTYPLEGEVSSGNEGPYGASSHHGGDENESRADRIIQSSEAETTEAGLSGGSDDLAALHLVPEPMVVEQVSSHSLPESAAVEKAPTDTFSSPYPSMDQVPLHISDPEIPVDEKKEILLPLMQEPIVKPPQGVHEESQTLFLMEKPSLNGEEPQEKSTILMNTTEETTIIPSKKEPVVFQNETEDKEKSKPSEIHET